MDLRQIEAYTLAPTAHSEAVSKLKTQVDRVKMRIESARFAAASIAAQKEIQRF